MATIDKRGAYVANVPSGGMPPIIKIREGILQTFKKGALLYLTASGTCKVFTSTTTTSGYDQQRVRILGIAMDDANNSASPTTDIQIALAAPSTTFIANVASRTSAATASLALAQVGKAVGASLNSSRTFVDLNASAAATIFRIVQLLDAVGDQYGRVMVQVLTNARLIK